MRRLPGPEGPVPIRRPALAGRFTQTAAEKSIIIPPALVLELRRGLQLLLSGVDPCLPPIIARIVVDRDRRGFDNDVAICNAQKATNRDHVADDASLADDGIFDLADSLIGSIAQIKIINLPAEDCVLRNLDGSC